MYFNWDENENDDDYDEVLFIPLSLSSHHPNGRDPVGASIWINVYTSSPFHAVNAKGEMVECSLKILKCSTTLLNEKHLSQIRSHKNKYHN